MSIYIDREHKRAKSHIMKMAVVWALILLVKGSSVDDTSLIEVKPVDDDIISYKRPSICKIESKELGLAKYMNNPNTLRFIINISSNKSIDKGCMIVEESRYWERYYPEIVLTCSYKETERDGAIVRESVLPHMEKPKSVKIIAIPLVTEKTRKVYKKKMKEAEKIKKDPSRRTNIKKALEHLIRLMNICECRDYIPKIKECKSILYRIEDKNYKSYLSFENDIFFDDMKDLLPNSNVFDNSFIYCGSRLWKARSMDKLLETNRELLDEMKRKYPMYKIDDSRLKEILEENPENTNRALLSQVKDFEKECEGLNTYTGTKEELSEYAMSLITKAKDLAIAHINMLTGEGVPISKQENEVLREYITQNSEKIGNRAAPWNRNLVMLLIKSWLRYNRIEMKQQRGIDNIMTVFREETRKIIEELELQDDIESEESIHMPTIINIMIKIVDILKIGLEDSANSSSWEWFSRKEKTEIDKQDLNYNNIELSDRIIFQLLHISKVGKDPEITQDMLNSIKEKINPLIYKISECYIDFTSIEELIKSFEESKKEIVDVLHSIAFENQVLTEPKCERVIFLKEMLRETLNSFADFMHYTFAGKINYNKCGLVRKTMKEEIACLENCIVKKTLQYILEFANKFWYTPESYSRLINRIEDAIAQENTLEYIIEKWDPYEIKKILIFTYQAYKSINDLVMCDEIWENPAVLYLERPHEEKRKSFFIYKENGTTYIEKIDFNNSNLEVIRNAKSHSDIAKAIEKEKEQIIDSEEALLKPRKRLYLSKDKESRKRTRSSSSESE